ncbi:MAG: M35 family metallo-endopeptidase [Pseudomonadota bacterium]
MLASHIACKLTHLSAAQVLTIEGNLNSILSDFIGNETVRNGRTGVREVTHSRQDRLNLRRARLLVQHTLSPAQPRRPGFGGDENRAYLADTAATAPYSSHAVPGGNAALPAGGYLGPSYWAYAPDAHQLKARQAATEAVALLNAGWRVADSQSRGTAQPVFAKWFNNAPPASVLNALASTRNAFTTGCVGIGYAGPDVGGNPYRLQEKGATHGGNFGIGLIEHTANLVGDALQRPGARWLRLCGQFFTAEAGPPRTTAHDIGAADAANHLSRGGAVVHEAMHNFAERTDEVLAGTGLAYGPRRASALATANGVAAARNADNYRLFCEDALLLG